MWEGLMNKNYFALFIVSFASIYLSAMQEETKQVTTVYALNLDCIQTIARYLDQKTCANARKSCKFFNALFWNDSAPLVISPVEIKSMEDAVKFWDNILTRISAAESLIKRFNPNLDATKVDIQNPVIMKVCGYRFLAFCDELHLTTCVRALDVSNSLVCEEALALLPRLLPLLYELKLIGGGKLIDKIPQEFRQWTSLKRLFLGGNGHVRDSLEASLPRSLEYLDMSYFSDLSRYKEIPQFLKEMTKLKGLNLSHSGPFLPGELAKIPRFCPQLEELDLSYNCLCMIPLCDFRLFKRLLRLNVYENDLCIFTCLFRLPSVLPELEEFDLGQNGLKRLWAAYGQFKKLKLFKLCKHAGNNGDRWERENNLPPEDQEKIREMLPHTKIIFPSDH